jgi:hypothetical protein
MGSHGMKFHLMRDSAGVIRDTSAAFGLIFPVKVRAVFQG